jgi:sugar/nucleoside kinase (ribokinase family)
MVAVADVGSAGILVADTFCGVLDALPAPGELLALDAMPASAGGCAANVAINLAKQAVSVDVIGCLGRDAAAHTVIDGLHNAGVSTEQIIYVDETTSQTVILVVRGEDRRFLHMFGANKALALGMVARDWLKTLKVFYLGGVYVLPGIDPAQLAETLRFCREQGVITVVDVVLPKSLRSFEDLKLWLPQVDYFVPNDDEARQITGLDDPAEQARALTALGARHVVVTAGEAGLVAAGDRRLWRAGSFRVEAVDMSGSGDAFSAGLITGIVRGWDMPDMLRYASALGASATLAMGTTTSVFTAAQAQAFLQTHPLEIVED